ncbi:MAG: hypothetical protein ACI9U2_005190 [Bradymonadia bacterium]|jgi:hypothetical protein
MSVSSLIEQVVGAFRERDPDGRIKTSPAWHDLEAADREAAFEATLTQRSLEAALDADGLSSTARAVLARIVQA